MIMKKNNVVISPVDFDTDLVILPTNKIPVTLEFDDNRVVGEAELRKEKGKILANLTLDGEIAKHLTSYKHISISIGGQIEDDMTLKPDCLGVFYQKPPTR